MNPPSWYINPVFVNYLAKQDIFDGIPLTFASGLAEAITKEKPPGIDFFLSLPPPPSCSWGVSTGVSTRLAQYVAEGKSIPSRVKSALADGYHIAHRGLLCWAPIPPKDIRSLCRLRFVAIEAVFTFLFHACEPTNLDALWSVYFPWKKEAVTWEPACSHCALIERPRGNFSQQEQASLPEDDPLSEEERLRQNEERKALVKERMRLYHKLAEDRKRAKDVDAYTARKRREKMA
ncbi:H(+)-transporting V1 sector ATPase subunit A [Neopestalotiopsis sp. 37M]|nr:H(+)-transporting V1 sector ATPase subunit A [Neopestalotiopsis sp. 37M]